MSQCSLPRAFSAPVWTTPTLLVCLLSKGIPALWSHSWPSSVSAPTGLHFSCAGEPEKEGIFQVRSHESRTTSLSWLATLLLMEPRMLLAFWTVIMPCCHVELLLHEHLQVFLLRSALNPSLSWYLSLDLSWPPCRALHLTLLNFKRFTWAHLSSLSRSLWMPFLPSSTLVSANCVIIMKKWSIKNLLTRSHFILCQPLKWKWDQCFMLAPRQSDLLTSKKTAAHHSPTSLANAGARHHTQRALCNQCLDYPDHQTKLKDPAFLSTHFYISPTDFIKPSIYWYVRLGTTTRNKVEVSVFLLQIILTGKQWCFSLYICIFPCMDSSASVGHLLESHRAGSRGAKLRLPQQLLCNSSNLIEGKEW